MTTVRPPLPVTVLTGFLGAGKTTLLRRLLAAPHDRRIGVILNEIGQTGIDDLPEARQRELVELSEGCVCCLRSPDLLRALRDMHARGDLDLVIVETTGLADPLALTWIIGRPDLEDVARLDCVITVVDALNHDKTQVDEWRAQLACADLLVVAKLDVAPADAVEAVRTAAQAAGSGARLVDGRDLPLGLLFDLEPDPGARAARAAATPEARHTAYRVVSIADPARFRSDAVEDLIESLPASVYRAKGIVKLGDGRFAAFHSVGGRVDFQPDAPPPAHDETRIVLLGPELDEPALRAAFAECHA